ncbi:MAG: hypothetical protein ACR2HH_02860 [Chthoniobacterales bacterium]
MKRFLLLLLVGAAVAIGIWFAIRSGGLRTSSASVTALLPKETLALIHVPDVNSTRAKWHETDLYKLWREPAMQDFLQKPLTNAPKANELRQKLQQLDALQIKDAFFAITAFENKQPKMLAGFRFKGSADDAEKVIGQWRARAQLAAPAVKRETIAYAQHQIEVVSHEQLAIATVYDGNWFFAGNDLTSLKALLDRADGRAKDAAGTLTADAGFATAFKHMPMSYAVFAYGRLDQYFARLAATMPQEAAANENVSILRQIRGIAAASTFENGKIRDVLFVAMPKIENTGELTRSSLSLATAESFLYAASFLHLPHQMPDATKAAANGFPPALQNLMNAFAAKGITLDSWKSAFGAELGVIGDWPQNARLPALFATLPVKDAAKAREIMSVIAANGDESGWKNSEKDGVQYFTQPPPNPMVPIGPTIALSNQLIVAGLDPISVETAIKRGAASSGLGASQSFKSAEALVPAPQNAFAYIDTALFYTRLDAAIRPMLIMAAAFMPAVADSVDLGKLPASDVIARHLSPIVMSQTYQTDGYMTESVGPVSIYQAIVSIGAASVLSSSFYQKHSHPAAHGMPSTMSAPAAVSPTPEADETAEPAETPAQEPDEPPTPEPNDSPTPEP